MLPAEVEPHLHTRVVGRRLLFYPETDSTNDVAAGLARGGEPEGTVVYADFQRCGRGRQGHGWTSPSGKDLLFSVLLRPQGEPREVVPVTLAVSLALSVALEKRVGATVGVKWPNDLVTSKGKLGGILAESGSDEDDAAYSVVGVGVNVNTSRADFPPELRDRAVSCRTLTGSEVDRAALFGALLTSLETYYLRFRVDGFAPLVSAYEERMLLMGRRVRFEREGSEVIASVAGVRADGALRVIPDGGGPELALVGETVEVVE
jgi:BirA family biotin operon repressor/biotin-[acetyl-CoA-carboxylase] ligase